MTKKYPVYRKTPVIRKYVFSDTGATSESANSVLLWIWNTSEHHNKPYTVIEIKDKVLPDYYRSLPDAEPIENSELKEIEILNQVYIRERAEDFESSGGYGTVGGQAEDRADRTLSPILESVFLMVADGNRLELPKDTHFKNYTQVKEFLIKAGGKYKKLGFEFNKDAQDIKDRLLEGETINDKKKFQLYETQPNEVKRIHELAEIDELHWVLEPSVGLGNLINDLPNPMRIHCIEFNEDTYNEFKERGASRGLGLELADFLKVEPNPTYDRIVANPPFNKNQDIKHIRHMYEFLNPGGRLVSVAGGSWLEGTQKIQKDFRAWLKKLNAHIEDIEDGAFKKSGANFASVIIVINKEA